MGASRGTFAVVTLGCKAGQCDGEAIWAGLVARGYLPAPPSEAGLVVVNGCAVTLAAEGKGRKVLGRVRRANPLATVAVAGCLARLRGEVLAAGKAADLVLPGDPGWAEPGGLGPRRRSRPLLKVQDGCDRSCAYCVVPALRGAPRSLPPARVVSTLRALMEGGAGEVALAGIHLGLWGRDLHPPAALEDLVEQVAAARLPGRVRLSSLEAGDVTDRLLALVAGSGGRVCPHLHIPLQSGSDRVLLAMGRPGGAAAFAAAVEKARASLPDAGIGTDIIAGFPGETGEDFARSLGLVKELGIPFVHAFPFSPRPGTRAAGMDDDVPPAAKRGRVRMLMAEGAANRSRFLARTLDLFGGGTLLVALEGGRDPVSGRRRGRAGNYLTVLVAGGEGIPRGSLARVRVSGARGGSLFGEVTP